MDGDVFNRIITELYLTKNTKLIVSTEKILVIKNKLKVQMKQDIDVAFTQQQTATRGLFISLSYFQYFKSVLDIVLR